MSLIRLYPEIGLNVTCPNCLVEVKPSRAYITGMHSMAEVHCAACNSEYFIELPINAGMFYPGIIDRKTGERKDSLPFENWYLTGLVNAFKNRISHEVDLKIEAFRPLERSKTVLLNCIDSTYGHALFELLNASYYLKNKELDLIILVQKNMRWLIPDGTAEIWTVDIGFSQAVNWYDDLANKVNSELNRIGKPVELCQTFVQADSLDYEIEDYTRVKPFPLSEWDARLEKPTVTFIWRTDRFWRKILPSWMDNRISRKLFPKILKNIRDYYQFKWVLRFSAALKLQIPNLDYSIAGMDTRDFKLPDWIKDYRFPKHEDETAREQCQRYAESHLVMGCNGSSLILPGCHSGAMIDIVPGDMWSVSAGSFPFRISESFGETHYRYILLPQEVSIKRLVSITVAMLRDRALIQLHTASPWRNHDNDLPPSAWSQFRVHAHSLSRHFESESGLVTTKLKDL